MDDRTFTSTILQVFQGIDAVSHVSRNWPFKNVFTRRIILVIFGALLYPCRLEFSWQKVGLHPSGETQKWSNKRR